MKLQSRVCEILEIDHPIVLAGMGGASSPAPNATTELLTIKTIMTHLEDNLGCVRVCVFARAV